MTALDHHLVPYDAEKHSGFLFASWTHGARRARGDLSDLLRGPAARLCVAVNPEAADVAYGWAAVLKQAERQPAVIWVYVRNAFDGSLRRRGLMRSMLTRLGVDLAQPIPCLEWSPFCTAIAAAGKLHPFPAGDDAWQSRRRSA